MQFQSSFKQAKFFSKSTNMKECKFISSLELIISININNVLNEYTVTVITQLF